MYKKVFLPFFICFFYQLASGQQYWQQQVDVQIDARLNENDNTVDASIQLHYINNSPDTLRYIWLHLWPNAYKNDKTAFSDQQLRNGNTDFYFSEEADRGYINRLNFKVDGTAATLTDHPQHQDIVRLNLPVPLAPGTAAEITSPFHLKLPAYFSRSGVTKNLWSVTQWFPKPAVYDKEGWHPMPYLDQGEFYSEFGNYKVTLDVPEHFMIAATGAVENSVIANGRKQQTFVQSHVHDFAWFASPDFKVMHDTMHATSGLIDLYAYYQSDHKTDWAPAIRFIKKAVLTKEAWVGAYPYKTISVVDLGDAESQGGMEYPTITLISNMKDSMLLDHLINDEVGHNWFYGVLASNERRFPWMDEGMNSYYDKRYSREMYGTPAPDLVPGMRKFFSRRMPGDYSKLLLRTLTTMKQDQPINTASDNFSAINYNMIAYEKTAEWMELLESRLGRPTFDKVMQSYYKDFSFRHPSPQDFKYTAEAVSGENLDSLFQLLQQKGPLQPTGKKEFKAASFFNLKETNKYNYVSVLPALGYNFYDQFMLGALLHNYQLPPTHFQFFAAPMFATGSKTLTGIGRLSYQWFPGSRGAKAEAFVAAAHFTGDSFKDSTGKTNFQPFTKIAPGFRFTFANSDPRSTARKYLQLKTFFITETGLLFTRDSSFNTTISYPEEKRNLAQLRFVYEQNRALYPFDASFQSEVNKDFIRTTFTGNYFFNYPKTGGLQVRLFAGKFFYTGEKTFLSQFETDRYHLNMTGPKGYEDYTYENYFLGRNEFEGLANQQIMIRDGAFKVRTDLLSSKIGKTDDWLAALNLNSTIPDKINPLSILPFRLPLRFFLDIGTYADAWAEDAGTSRFLYDAGLQLSLLQNTVNVYVPIMYSKVYQDYYKSTIPDKRFWKTISISIDVQHFKLNKLFPQIPF